MAEPPRVEALPEDTTFRDIAPTLNGKTWFMVRADDVEGFDKGLASLGRGDASGEMTPRDPRDIGVRGGYPQLNMGLPSQDQALLRFVRFAYRRSAPARLIVDKVASDVWGEWVDFQTSDEALRLALEAVCKNPTGRPGDRPLWWHIEQAYRQGRRDGRALLYFVLEDSNAATPSLPPGVVRGIRNVIRLRQEHIEAPIIGVDVNRPDEYGRVLGWKIRVARDSPLGKAGTSVQVHAERCVPIIPYPMEDDEWNGESILAQNINYVEMLENLVWANAEAYFTEASPYIVVSADKDVVLSESERAEAKRAVGQMQQSTTQRIFLRGVTVHVLSGSGSLANPLPHFEVALKMFAMALGGMPTSMLTGDSGGSDRLSAARADSDRYRGMNSKVQEQDADPILRAILARFIRWDVKRWAVKELAPVDFTWNPLFESDPQQEANTQLVKAQARWGYVDRRLPIPSDLEWEPTTDKDLLDLVTQEPQPERISELINTSGGPGGGALISSVGDKRKRGDARIAPPGLDGVIRRMRARIHRALGPAFAAAAARARGGRLDADVNVSFEGIFLDPALKESLTRAILESFEDAMQVGGNATLDMLDRDDVYEALKGSGIKAFVSLADGLSQNVLRRLTDEVRKTVADGITKGQSPSTIAQRIEDRYGATRVDADRIARTESIRAYNRGTLDVMQQVGVNRFRFTAFSDADDGNPDGPCAENDGKEFTIEQADAIPPLHPNCRCSILPIVVG